MPYVQNAIFNMPNLHVRSTSVLTGIKRHDSKDWVGLEQLQDKHSEEMQNSYR